MIDELYIGVYWKHRPLTLAQYASELRGFLSRLQTAHPAFQTLAWVGNRPNASVAVAENLANLDDIVRCHSWSKRDVRGGFLPDGTVNPQLMSAIGFLLIFNTGVPPANGGIYVSVRAGALASRVPDAVVLRWGCDPPTVFPEFLDAGFLQRLFADVIDYWRPDWGLVTSPRYAKAVCPDSLPRVGWLTYVADTGAYESLADFPKVELGTPGPVFSTGGDPVRGVVDEQVRAGVRLRDALRAARLP